MKKDVPKLLKLMLAFLLLIGSSSAFAQSYSCTVSPQSVSYNNNGQLSFNTSDYVVINYTAGNTWDDQYYYQITDNSVSSVDATNLSGWIKLYDDNTVGPNFYTTQHTVNANLTCGNYKLWIMNNACANPTNSVRDNTFSTGNISYVYAEDLNNGKINIQWDPNFNATPVAVEYCVYKSSDSPTTYTSTTSFYPNKIVNVSKDQDGNALAINTMYKIALRTAECTFTTLSNLFTIQTCTKQVSDILVTDHQNGKINVTWTGVSPAPADGYAWAIFGNNQTSPSYPADFRFTSGTTLTNVDTTYNGVAFDQNEDYYVVVYSVCDTSTSYSSPIYSSFNVVTCSTLPSNLVLTQTADNEIKLQWTAATPAPSDYFYSVVKKSDNYIPSYPADYTSSTNTTTVSGVNTAILSGSLVNLETYKVYVLSQCGAGSYSTPISGDIKINNCTNAPVQVDLNMLTPDSLSLKWNAPTPVPVNGYAYAVAKVGTTPVYPTDYTVAATAPSTALHLGAGINNVAFEKGKKYVAYVVSICGGGASLPTTDTVMFTTCQSAPTGLAVTQNTGKLTISFTGTTPAPADGYLYAVTLKGVVPSPMDYVIATGSPIANIDETTNDNTPLAHNSEYTVSVKAACDLSKNYVSVDVNKTIKINNCAAPPVSVVATATSNSITATWVEPTPASVDGYAVYAGGNITPSYPSDFYFVSDTNSVLFVNVPTGTYYVQVVSVCGSSHSDSVSTIVSVTNCDDIQISNITTQTNVNGLSASWTASSTPANGYAFAVTTSNTVYLNELTYIGNNTSIANVDTLANGSKLVSGNGYYLHIVKVCDSTNNIYSDIYQYFNYNPCKAPTDINVWINANGTLSATWNSNNTSVDKYLYAVGNNNGPLYPLYPVQYSSTSAANVSNIATTFDNVALAKNNTYYIEVYAVCSTTKNIVSYSNDNSVFYNTPSCNANFYLNTNYVNNALSITVNTYSAAPAQGYKYAIFPTNGNTSIDEQDPIFYKAFVSNPSTMTNTMAGITKTTLNNETFIAGNQYDVYVMAICDSLEEEYVFRSASFTAINPTTTCNSVYNLQIIDNNNKSININWDYSGIPANGYEYAVLPIGTALQNSFFQPTMSAPVYNIYTTAQGDSLVNATAYAVYVRVKCGATSYSEVESKSITLHSTLSLAEATSESANVYPNPVSSTLTIELPSAEAQNATVSILDVTGKLVYTSTLSESISTIDVQNLVNGVYLLNIKSESVQSTTRIIKQ